jgi:predicted RNase H-like HicB family nuclease
MQEETKVEIVVEANDDGSYSASAPLLPGCIAQGKTVEEALDNMKAEIKIYMENLMQEVLTKAKKDGLV